MKKRNSFNNFLSSVDPEYFRLVKILIVFLILVISYGYETMVEEILGIFLSGVYVLSLIIFLSVQISRLLIPRIKSLSLFITLPIHILLLLAGFYILIKDYSNLMEALSLVLITYSGISIVKLKSPEYLKGRKIPIFQIIQTTGLILLIFFVINQQISIQNAFSSLENLKSEMDKSTVVKCDEDQAINSSRDSIVRVVGGEGEGSGFFVEKQNHILTNFHVIEHEPAPRVVYSDNSFEVARVVAADKTADLAILEVSKQRNLLNLGNPSMLNSSDGLIAMGYPFGGELNGEATVKKGYLTARRFSKDVGVEYLQMELPLNPGMSGGPVFDKCGDVYGVNTMTYSGLGFAISSDSVRQKWDSMMSDPNPLKDVEKLDLDPSKSPLDAVQAFYGYVKTRKLSDAFDLLSDNFKKGYRYTTWKKGYDSLLDTSVLAIHTDLVDPDKINVRLSTKDFIDGDIVYKYFEGSWSIVEKDGKYLLDSAEIEDVGNPSYEWFLE